MMNNTTKIVINIIIVLLYSQYLVGQSNPDALSGDMGFKLTANSSYKMQVTMTCASIPFEGLTNPDIRFRPFNRVGKVQNGSIWRFFSSQGTIGAEKNIYKISSSILNNGEVFDLMHSSGSEYEFSINYVYGYSKYLVEVLIYYNNIETERYRYFYNTLDSKFGGKDTISNTTYYIGDLYVEYNITLPLNRRLEIYKDVRSGVPNPGLIPIDTISTSDTLNDGTPKKELKVWEIKYPSSSFPVEQNFYASTTPFGLRPESFENGYSSEFIIGTKVVFDSVYNNKDVGTFIKDTIGYNTRDDNSYHRYYTTPPIGFNDYGNTYTTTAWFNNNSNGITFIADSSTTLEFKKNKKLWVSGPGNENIYDVLILKENSKIIHYENSGIYTFRYGKIIDEGCNITWAPNTIHRAYVNTEFIYQGSEHIVNNGGKVQIDSLATLSLGANTTLVFDGNNTNLELKSRAIVKLGQNAKIVFKNGAYLKADNANFSGLNGATWEGIVFENAGTANEIKNCTFSNAKSSLRFDNNTYGESSKAEIINNTFNVPQLTTAYGVYGNNMFKLNIKDNRFYNQSFNGTCTNVGVYLKSSFNPGPPPEEDATPYALTIQYNLFKGGKAGIILANYASQYIPYSIYYNNFNDSSSYFSDYGIIGRKIDGDIKHCVFYPGKFNHNINVTQSNIRVANSHLNSNYYNFNLNNYSSLDIGGTESSGYNVYLGGFNYLSSINNTNIYLSYYQSIYLQNGRNCFLNNGGSGYYHLNGVINTEDTILKAAGNSWSTGIPVYSLVNRNDSNMIVNYNPVYNCNTTTGLQIHQIVDKGNGLIDTIYKLPNSTTFLNPETNLYLQAQQYVNNSNYPTSILNLKTLISQYPSGMYLPYILNDLYLNYEKLDTSSNQVYRDNLYSDLKNFLNEKINSGLYDFQFNDLAYQLVLMCDGNMQNYNDALTGYEFIAMYHPDATTRLLASWDYVEIDALLNGMGGGNSENISEEVFAKNEMKRLEKVIRKDSLLTSLKRNYDKLSKEQSRETKTDLKSKNIDVYERALFKKEKDEKINRKSLTVLMGSKSMSKELKAEKQLEDILLISSTNSDKKEKEENATLPGNYSLSQNYPNPFNPVTKINFALPKQGFVTLKIYDIIGREIKTLVNEVKQAGYYTVDFNGSSLASGVYFYRIQSGDFISVKRMVLVK